VDVLVIGGTEFSGRHLVELAAARGHAVTVFHRGRHEPAPVSAVEHVHGDREDGPRGLDGRRFDAVIDMCGYAPAAVRAWTRWSSQRARAYVFVSSLSVHVDEAPAGAGEDDALREPADRGEPYTDDRYGELKLACEREVRDAFGDRACVVRPGLIAGPFDPTDRFTYWVRRADLGGELLAPAPPDEPVQWIDARDLAAFLLSVSERGVGGIFGAATPRGFATMGDLVAACIEEAGAGATATWVDGSYLRERGVEPWSDLPLWMPGLPGFLAADTSRAAGAGLTCRPLRETVRDTLAWDRTRDRSLPLAAGIDRERERDLLETWHAIRS
jgi:2'-hydroxyisoflavone reductase